MTHQEIDGIYEADKSQAVAFMMLVPQASTDALSATNLDMSHGGVPNRRQLTIALTYQGVVERPIPGGRRARPESAL